MFCMLCSIRTSKTKADGTAGPIYNFFSGDKSTAEAYSSSTVLFLCRKVCVPFPSFAVYSDRNESGNIR